MYTHNCKTPARNYRDSAVIKVTLWFIGMWNQILHHCYNQKA